MLDNLMRSIRREAIKMLIYGLVFVLCDVEVEIIETMTKDDKSYSFFVSYNCDKHSFRSVTPAAFTCVVAQPWGVRGPSSMAMLSACRKRW